MKTQAQKGGIWNASLIVSNMIEKHQISISVPINIIYINIADIYEYEVASHAFWKIEAAMKLQPPWGLNEVDPSS